MYIVYFYGTEEGKCPVQEFIDSAEPKMKSKILKTIDLLEVNGPTLREPFSSSMGNGIFELRVKVGSNITRIFYFFVIGKIIILTNGIVKKTQKTPKGDLELARKYKADYERRFLK